jgi:oxygen-independent coproporphyrinogen-3 oxidase
MFSGVIVDANLIARYGGNGPRYTSYPTADRFVEAFDAEAYRHWLHNRKIGSHARPLSVYVHLPFCDTVCYYCACNKIVTRRHERAAPYLAALAGEAALVGRELGDDRQVEEIHLGGGTPTFFSDRELRQLLGILSSTFALAPKGERAIEVDPRSVTPGRVALLAELGFNRISMGVQDFDPEVQRAVNRIQTVEQTLAVTQAARRHGFRSVNYDLIYGLPRQTTEGFERTLDLVCDAAPDRIALYSYAHLPRTFMPQRRIAEAELPSPGVKLALMTRAIEKFGAAGYVYIGMDHFAKPHDDLAIAQRQGRLARNFQGYSSGGETDTIGLGVSAIGSLGPAIIQNHKDLAGYTASVDAGELPVMRGIEAGADDLVRRMVIQSLACHGRVSKESVSISHLIDFDRYFAVEMRELLNLRDDGLVDFDDEWISVTPVGRLLTRSVCMVFDRYLREGRERAGYSRVL